jgi:hypothetical protein
VEIDEYSGAFPDFKLELCEFLPKLADAFLDLLNLSPALPYDPLAPAVVLETGNFLLLVLQQSAHLV